MDLSRLSVCRCQTSELVTSLNFDDEVKRANSDACGARKQLGFTTEGIEAGKEAVRSQKR